MTVCFPAMIRPLQFKMAITLPTSQLVARISVKFSPETIQLQCKVKYDIKQLTFVPSCQQLNFSLVTLLVYVRLKPSIRQQRYQCNINVTFGSKPMDKFLFHMQSCLALDLKKKKNSYLLGTAHCDKKLEERFYPTLHVLQNGVKHTH